MIKSCVLIHIRVYHFDILVDQTLSKDSMYFACLIYCFDIVFLPEFFCCYFQLNKTEAFCVFFKQPLMLQGIKSAANDIFFKNWLGLCFFVTLKFV